jgi:hypothetical protein
VDVALNEAGKDCRIAGVEDTGATAIIDSAIGYGRNASVTNSDVSLKIVSVGDHWQDQPAPDHEIRRN